MIAGKLDKRLTFQMSEPSKELTGEEINTWVDCFHAWANIDYKGGKEPYEADKKTAINEVTFKLRFRRGINEKMRILFNGEIYDILHIAEIQRRQGLEIKAEKKF